MNQKQLEKKVKYWQKILKLDHWDITCELIEDERDIEGHIGRGYPQSEYFSAHIKFLNPKHYRGGEKIYSVEGKHLEGKFDRLVVHELLHCHTSGIMSLFDKSQEATKEEERLVTSLEKSFYDLWAGEEI